MDITNITIDAGPDLHGALCAQTDPEAFFPEPAASSRYAQKICVRCPVKRECLNWAVETYQDHGVWGGTTPNERKAIRRNRRMQHA